MYCKVGEKTEEGTGRAIKAMKLSFGKNVYA